jgi:hypothetical protein
LFKIYVELKLRSAGLMYSIKSTTGVNGISLWTPHLRSDSPFTARQEGDGKAKELSMEALE